MSNNSLLTKIVAHQALEASIINYSLGNYNDTDVWRVAYADDDINRGLNKFALPKAVYKAKHKKEVLDRGRLMAEKIRETYSDPSRANTDRLRQILRQQEGDNVDEPSAKRSQF